MHFNIIFCDKDTKSQQVISQKLAHFIYDSGDLLFFNINLIVITTFE